MSKQKYFSKETLSEAMQILQPVSPTNEDFRAHWYNEGFGLKIKIIQDNYTKALKHALVDCSSKAEISNAIFQNPFPKWPIYIKPYENNQKELEKANLEFWTKGFGLIIRTEWNKMFQKFILSLNSLK